MNSIIHLTSRVVDGAKIPGTVDIDLGYVPSGSGSLYSLQLHTKEPDGNKADISIYFDDIDQVIQFRNNLDRALAKHREFVVVKGKEQREAIVEFFKKQGEIAYRVERKVK